MRRISRRDGQTVGGIPFTRGPLAYLLRNRFYVGKVVFKGEALAGEQPAIVDQDLFDAVQAKLNEQINNHRISRTRSEALLLGRIYDDRGHKMTPSHTRKRIQSDGATIAVAPLMRKRIDGPQLVPCRSRQWGKARNAFRE
ncbi:MAG: recombinase family protein, partial [Rhodoplanes sp.]